MHVDACSSDDIWKKQFTLCEMGKQNIQAKKVYLAHQLKICQWEILHQLIHPPPPPTQSWCIYTLFGE